MNKFFKKFIIFNKMIFFKKTTFEEAQKRLSHRKDIKLIKENYKGWTIKSEFYDLIQGETFWSIPRYACKSECCHPKRRKVLNFQKKSISYKKAKQKFIDQGRTDIELIEDGFKGWGKESKFYDFEEKDYFWSVPKAVYHTGSVHLKRSIKNRTKKRMLPFEEAQKRLKYRKDIKLIKDGYNGWKVKSKFWDNIEKDYFSARPNDVLKDNSCHPNRYKISKAQIELFQHIKKQLPKLKIVSECRNIINNNNYVVDILVSKYNIIIEYNGDYWHCNPIKYKENYFHKKKKMYAKEIWEYDKIRKEELEKAGYKVLIVWEYDYKNNKEQVLQVLKEQINIISNS